MIFNSFSFLWFFPLFLIAERFLPQKIRWMAMLAMSYYFYACWQPTLIVLILFTTAVSYLCSLGISKTEKKGLRKLYLVIALIASLSVLIFFKYYNFLAANISGLLSLAHINTGDLTLNLILPVGISFYTFQTLSYVIDVYRGTMPAEKHFGYYALYVSFFPQLVAGPIERPDNLLPQLKERKPFNPAEATYGLKMMAVGFFKKLAVADQLAVFVNAVYNDVSGENTNGFTAALATVLFAVQIYCDFSGYTDIAIGVARVMGIKLMQNFNAPYSATSIRDFWKRWHISLTTWFTDYIYIPLGGSRCSKAKHLSNIFTVFLISGLWHGAAWTYVLWGVVHGLYQIVGILTKAPRAKLLEKLKIPQDSPWLKWARRGFTFILVCLAWVAFRANSLSDMIALYRQLFTGWGSVNILTSLEALGLSGIKIATVILSIIALDMLDKQVVLSTPAEEFKPTLAASLKYVVLCWAVAAAWLLLLSSGGASSFIYFQF